MLKRLLDKIERRKAKVAVIGLGYVGLPLAVTFSEQGFSVLGIDIDEKKVALLKRGKSYILDVPASRLRKALASKKLSFTVDFHKLSTADAVILCVPTPLSKTKEPDISFIVNATRMVASFLKKAQLVVLESTTYPGTTEEVMLPMLERSGLRVERDFFLAFSPERVDPGNKQYSTESIPKVVGGVGPNSSAAARALYGAVLQSVVPVSSAKTAEMVKLLENTFRSVNIGLINEMALLSNRLGVDIWEVIAAAKTKPFGFMPFYPGPGIGGHCLPIDPLYLSWKSRLHGYEAKLIDLASSINEAMPLWVVERLMMLLNQKGSALKKSPILVLGVSYKKNINDTRESPALEVIEALIKEGAAVSYSDPHVPALEMGARRMRSQTLTPALLKKQQCVVILTDHSAFDPALIVKHAKLVFDTRNHLRRFKGARNVFFL